MGRVAESSLRGLPPAGSGPVNKGAVKGERRRHELRRLLAELQKVQAAIKGVQQETEALFVADQSQRDAPGEAERLRALRFESERLRYELQELFREFERLRAQ